MQLKKITIGNKELKYNYCTAHKYFFVNKEADSHEVAKDVFNSDLSINEIRIFKLLNKAINFKVVVGEDKREYVLIIETEANKYTIFIKQEVL